MIAMVVCIRRNPALNAEEFSKHWHSHAEDIRNCINFAKHIKSYVQYHQPALQSELSAMFGAAADYDGVAVLKFEDETAMTAAFAEPDYLTDVQPDESRFVDVGNCMTFVLEESVVI